MRCQNVVHIYTTVAGHDVVALRGVNLDIAPGEQVALLGPSGSGKSTLLGLFGGLQRASAGKVIVDGVDISRIPEAELTRLRAGKVASLLQGARRNLLTYATAAGNVEFASRGMAAADVRACRRPRQLLDMLGLGELSRQARERDVGRRAAARRAGGDGVERCRPAALPTSRPRSSVTPTATSWSTSSSGSTPSSAPPSSSSPTTPTSPTASRAGSPSATAASAPRACTAATTPSSTRTAPSTCPRTGPTTTRPGSLVEFEETDDGFFVRRVDMAPPGDHSMSTFLAGLRSRRWLNVGVFTLGALRHAGRGGDAALRAVVLRAPARPAHPAAAGLRDRAAASRPWPQYAADRSTIDPVEPASRRSEATTPKPLPRRSPSRPMSRRCAKVTDLADHRRRQRLLEAADDLPRQPGQLPLRPAHLPDQGLLARRHVRPRARRRALPVGAGRGPDRPTMLKTIRAAGGRPDLRSSTRRFAGNNKPAGELRADLDDRRHLHDRRRRRPRLVRPRAHVRRRHLRPAPPGSERAARRAQLCWSPSRDPVRVRTSAAPTGRSTCDKLDIDTMDAAAGEPGDSGRRRSPARAPRSSRTTTSSPSRALFEDVRAEQHLLSQITLAAIVPLVVLALLLLYVLISSAAEVRRQEVALAKLRGFSAAQGGPVRGRRTGGRAAARRARSGSRSRWSPRGWSPTPGWARRRSW